MTNRAMLALVIFLGLAMVALAVWSGLDAAHRLALIPRFETWGEL